MLFSFLYDKIFNVFSFSDNFVIFQGIFSNEFQAKESLDSGRVLTIHF